MGLKCLSASLCWPDTRCTDVIPTTSGIILSCKKTPKQRHKLQTLLLLAYTEGVYTETSLIENEIPFFSLEFGITFLWR